MGAQLKKGSLGFGAAPHNEEKYKDQPSSGLERARDPNTQLETRAQ